MRTVLSQLRAQLARSGGDEQSGRALSIGSFIVLSLFSVVLTGLSWVDYSHPRSFEDVVVAVHDLSTRKQPMRLVEFEHAAFPLLFLEGKQAPYWNGARAVARVLRADDAELKALDVGDRTSLWVLPWTRKVTATPRMPLALSLMSVALLSVIFVSTSERRPRSWPFLEACLDRGEVIVPEGMTEERRHPPNGLTEVLLKTRGKPALTLPLILFGGWRLFVLFSAVVLVILLAANFSHATDLFDYEWMARFFFSLMAPAGLLLPVVGVLATLSSNVQVAWNEDTIWVHRRRISRSRIRRIALLSRRGRPALEILVQGWSQALLYSIHPIWIAGVLDRLGYTIEFSRNTLSEPLRLFGKPRPAV
jgi:hypothetical protein